MRTIPDELAARIESGAATLCHAWVVTRADGEAMGFTDHDRDAERSRGGLLGGQRLDGGGGRGRGGAGAGRRCRRSGGLETTRSREADIAAGLYDGAQVELWRVDWSAAGAARAAVGRDAGAHPAARGTLSSPSWTGRMAALERVVGRTYGRTCDAVLGDGRCRADLTRAAGAALRQALDDLRRDVRQRRQLPGLSRHSGRRLLPRGRRGRAARRREPPMSGCEISPPVHGEVARRDCGGEGGTPTVQRCAHKCRRPHPVAARPPSP